MGAELSESRPLPHYPDIQRVIDNFDPNIHKAVVISDVDQTIVDCVGPYLVSAQALLEEQYPWVNDITFDDVFPEGGIYKAFADCPEYAAAHNPSLIRDQEFNRNMILLDGRIPRVLMNLVEIGVLPGVYLTARPNEVREATIEMLSSQGCLGNAAVITRDMEKFENSNEWKLEVIKMIAEGIISKGGRVIILDDSSSLIDLVKRELASMSEGIIPLLMNTWEEDDNRRKFDLVDWENMEEVIKRKLGLED